MSLIMQINAPAEGLIYTTNNIKLKIGEKIVDSGTLFISPSALAWQPDSMPNGISILWKQISVHGISTDPSKCIYFMLDHKLVWRGVYEGPAAAAAEVNGHNGADGDGNAGDDGEVDEGNATDEEDELEEEQMTECWLIPEDANTVDTMFQAMTECQALHPDSADSISEESDFMDDDGGEDDNGAVGGVGLAPLGGGAAATAAANNGQDAAEAAAQGGMQNLNLNDRFADADE